ncbi:hypothetical protein AVEN_104975-1 [Araneus ventricosus]|uniref:Uncharacterized protein n=1 Tax=Araneus ventricosus TaxID=182803 RepID=A0A4Y2VKA3_ARAVE|nr:hypothetical protein AVEN_104975-1 [Araneus ventricosus]
MRGRKEGTSHCVLEALFEAFFKLRQLRKIPIKWAMYQMKEFLQIKRCSTCQAYGHTTNSKECKFTIPFCGCFGLRHNTRNCRNDELYCFNCAESNRNRGTNYKIRHRAICSRCPCYNKEVTAYKKNKGLLLVWIIVFLKTLNFPTTLLQSLQMSP